MSIRAVLRWCAIATVAAGALEVVVTSIEAFLPQGAAFSVQAAEPLWSVQQVPNSIAKLLLLFSLVGLYSREVRQAGRFGFVAFVVAFTGTALEFGTIWGLAPIAASLATNAPATLDSTVALAPVLAGIAIPFVLMVIGWPLFAVASLRAHVLPRVGLILIAVGPLLFFLGLKHVPDILFGAGLLLLGLALWSPSPVEDVQSTVVASTSAA